MKVGAVVSSNSLYWTDLFNKLKIKKSLPEGLDLPLEDSMEFICSCGNDDEESTVHHDRATGEYVVQGNCNLNKPCCAIAVDKHRLQRHCLSMMQPARPVPSQTIPSNAPEKPKQKHREINALSKLEEFLTT